MAPILFSRAVLAGRPIDVFNHGAMRRDFTYIDDIVDGVVAALDLPPPAVAGEPRHRVFNLGNNHPEQLSDFIAAIEHAAGRPAEKVMKPMQPGDMVETAADTQRAHEQLGFAPRTSIGTGIPQLVAWCRDYYGTNA
jgi:UDP-glucuronate 4-epimerase